MVTFDMIKNHLLVYGSVNVIIAGQTCSGKTTLAKEIRDHFLDEYSVAIISQDDYFKNLEDIPHSPGGYLTDSIDAFHVAEFRDDVYTLLKNSIVTMPNYDVATNTRINKNKIVSAGKINIFEDLRVCWSNLTYPYFCASGCVWMWVSIFIFFRETHTLKCGSVFY